MTDRPAVRGERVFTERERPVVCGVVLAGGASTRFDGGDKALAELDGRPLLARVLDAVDRATDGPPILAVADSSQERQVREAHEESFDGPVETVYDDPELSGPLAGLSAAADAANEPWLFVCACDMPLVTPASVEAVVTAARTTEPSEPCDAVVPVVDAYRQPLHALYRRSAVAAALDGLSTDDAMMALLDALDGVNAVPAADLDPSVARATTNVNTRADLDALREGSGSR
jgi:molybdopterin-guanine dinucleotide biosynthesis protein A